MESKLVYSRFKIHTICIIWITITIKKTCSMLQSSMCCVFSLTFEKVFLQTAATKWPPQKHGGNSTARGVVHRKTKPCKEYHELRGSQSDQNDILGRPFGSTSRTKITDPPAFRWWKRESIPDALHFLVRCLQDFTRKVELDHTEIHQIFWGNFGQKPAICFTCRAIAQA